MTPDYNAAKNYLSKAYNSTDLVVIINGSTFYLLHNSFRNNVFSYLITAKNYLCKTSWKYKIIFGSYVLL
jgi:hypothetical protein